MKSSPLLWNLMPEVSIHGPSFMLSWDWPLRYRIFADVCGKSSWPSRQVCWQAPSSRCSGGVGIERDTLFSDQSSEPESQGRAVSVKDVSLGARSPLTPCGALQNQQEIPTVLTRWLRDWARRELPGLWEPLSCPPPLGQDAGNISFLDYLCFLSNLQISKLCKTFRSKCLLSPWLVFSSWAFCAVCVLLLLNIFLFFF